MKRFFCTECKKVRRVRRMPANVRQAENVVDRTGTCDWHYSGARIVRMTPKVVQPKRVVISTSPVKVTRKRG